MPTVAIWLNDHCTGADRAVFGGVCSRVAQREETHVVDLGTGTELVELADTYPDGYVEHLVIAAHGGPTWILDDEHGLTTGDARKPGQETVWVFSKAWAPKLTKTPLISLAACLCSRSPRWFLRRKWDYLGSDWGRRGYLPGGQASISARIRDYLIWHRCFAEVRGHRTAGHATYNPILARHADFAGKACESWWALENPGKDPTLSERRAWVSEKQGQPAEDWLLGWS